jgi:exosortase
MATLSTTGTNPPLRPTRVLGAVAVLAVLGWSYYPAMAVLCGRWWSEQDYVYGFLVPPFAAFLLWYRRELMPEEPIQGNLWGLALLALCAAMRLTAAYLQVPLVDPLSIVPCLAGIVVLTAGWDGLRWTWPAILYLVFMVPLPSTLAVMLSQPLQQIGASTSTYLLQTVGIPAVAHGNVIALRQWDLGVEEACSGLRMLMLFLAVCAAAAMVIRRDPWERAVLVLSSAPIAVIANVIRITVTGILYETAGPELAEALFHDLAGVFMMPLAVILLWIEMIVLSLLFRPSLEEEWL